MELDILHEQFASMADTASLWDFLKLHVVAPNPTTQQAPVALPDPTQPHAFSAAHEPNPTQQHTFSDAHEPNPNVTI